MYIRTQPIPRIGFACKYKHPDRGADKSEINTIESLTNHQSTSVRWALANPEILEHRLWEIAEHNINSIFYLICYANSIDKGKMVRISSDILPLYTHPVAQWFYKQDTFIKYASKRLGGIGKYARDNDIRLSFHPGQFVALASDRPEVVENSIKEFEYHTDIIRWLGYGKYFQDFKCNIHLSGRGGESVFREAYNRLSVEAQNTITIENAEFGAGLDEVLELADICPIVLDVHHHWVRTGKYIRPTSPRVQEVIDSWRGVRPTLHYAYSREEVLLRAGHDDRVATHKPKFKLLDTDQRKLRAHSDFYPNACANDWALSFLPAFDIMCESKSTNLAAITLINYYKETL